MSMQLVRSKVRQVYALVLLTSCSMMLRHLQLAFLPARSGSNVARRSMSRNGASAEVALSKPICLSLDIDGTLADITRRLEYGAERFKVGSNAYWNTVLDGSHYHMDTPILPARSFVNNWLSLNSEQLQIRESRCLVYLSGRRSGTEDLTRSWLEHHGFPEGEIRHRPKGISSKKWKHRQLEEMRRKYEILAHFGDREDDVSAASMAGVRSVLVKPNYWTTDEEEFERELTDLLHVRRL
eukprot:TRINITY_DN81054_c0_g1_i1.p1 TRINITY_DN81054_c0_g1~~TRINITY_DN81054_c0_g1_i1.p1  ORF type:complete len:239 (+),score=19.93 TRINITY_DN81054_c0_g1_i1:96-812(+)